jgi:hypothetical protein
MRHLFTLLMLLFTVATIGFGQQSGFRKAGWHKIGEVKDFKTDMDGIMVDGPETFQSIKIKINEAPINITKVIIYYHNNKAEEVPLVGKVKEGETKIFKLKYPAENLRKVVLTHSADPNYESDKAHVELYGFKG